MGSTPVNTGRWIKSMAEYFIQFRYPTSFSEHERRVELTGEHYFEVASRIQNGNKIPF